MSVFRNNLPGMRLTSPAVVRMLNHIRRRFPVSDDPEIGEKIRLVQYEVEIPGSGNLWGRLAMSDLPRRLAARNLLPDVYEAMPGYAASWYRLFRPKTLEQQVDQVIEHLDWFVSPKDHEPSIYTLKATLQVLLTIMAFAVLFAIIATIGAAWGISLVECFGLFLGVGFLIWRIININRFIFYTPNQHMSKRQKLRRRNATVLYHYLLREFSEPVEDEQQ